MLTETKTGIKNVSRKVDFNELWDKVDNEFRFKFFVDGVADAIVDSHASIKDQESKIARMDSKIESLWRGEMSMRGEAAPRATTAERVAVRIASDRVNDMIAKDPAILQLYADKMGLAWPAESAPDEHRKKLVTAVKVDWIAKMAKKPEIIAEAEEYVARQKAVTVDIGAFGL